MIKITNILNFLIQRLTDKLDSHLFRRVRLIGRLSDDAGTVALMSEFYQNLASGSMKAQALRESQIAMLQGRVYLDRDRLRSSRGTVDLPSTLVKKQYDLSHPFYWAGFSLIGNPLRSIYSI